MSKRRILIVDDEVMLAKMLQLNLEKRGAYEVRVANSGSAGIRAAKEFVPEVVLLDLMMPDMDGTEVASRLAADAATKDAHVLFLTAVVQKAEVRAKGGVVGGRTFIAKPVEVGEVIEAIEKALSAAPAPRG
jgi:CheY-like chemotaxis protein